MKKDTELNEDGIPLKILIRFSYSREGMRDAIAYLKKHKRHDLVNQWIDTWQHFMVIFEANTLFRQKRKNKGFGTTKRKARNH